MNPLKILKGEVGLDEFASIIGMSSEEKANRRKALGESYMPFKVTESYARLIASQEEPYKGQMTNIVLPPLGKKEFKGRFDPYGNKVYRQDESSFLQHKYEKTLLLHIDDFCISNCQFCYKVREIRHEDKKQITIDEKVDMTLEYLSQHPEINNVLFGVS